MGLRQKVLPNGVQRLTPPSHALHSVQDMQVSQPRRNLLTATEVQELLQIDRSTVYRMAEDGRLHAIRVGRSWRFPAESIDAIATGGAAPTPSPAQPATASVPTTLTPGVDLTAARTAVAVAGQLLGVMMLVTDLHGRPLTDVSNPCPWFVDHGDEPDVMAMCVAEWQDMAAHPDLTPRFETGQHGFQCARALIRRDHLLVGMVLAGGLSPDPQPGANPDLHHLDESGRARVLAALPRIAAVISAAGETGDPTDVTAALAVRKEER